MKFEDLRACCFLLGTRVDEKDAPGVVEDSPRGLNCRSDIDEVSVPEEAVEEVVDFLLGEVDVADGEGVFLAEGNVVLLVCICISREFVFIVIIIVIVVLSNSRSDRVRG